MSVFCFVSCFVSGFIGNSIMFVLWWVLLLGLSSALLLPLWVPSLNTCVCLLGCQIVFVPPCHPMCFVSSLLMLDHFVCLHCCLRPACLVCLVCYSVYDRLLYFWIKDSACLTCTSASDPNHTLGHAMSTVTLLCTHTFSLPPWNWEIQYVATLFGHLKCFF